MGNLTIKTIQKKKETSIPNIFLDKYMPYASGEFVKVYLCLLRIASDPDFDSDKFSLSYIADLLNHTEKDVIRAIKYWEKEQLLAIDYEDDIPFSIMLLPFPSNDKTPDTAYMTEETATTDIAPKRSYNTYELNMLKADESVQGIVFVAERYLGKTLTSTELNTIIYIYDELHFSDDLFEYLLDYCITNEKRSLRYIEKVAISWNKEGINTVEKAKEAHAIKNKKVFSVMRAFGINDRQPGKPELDFISKWYDDYGFECDVIVEACNRTIQSLHKPSFEYTDTILSNWKKKNVHTLSDIAITDNEHAKNVTQKNYQNRTSPVRPTQPANNKFINFNQRNYNYLEMEQKLINKK